MTNGDKIREMDTWNLAVMFATALSERERILCKKLANQGVDVDLIESPVANVMAQFEWLEEECDDDRVDEN